LKRKEKEKKASSWKDYIALAIAMLTTTLLPLIIFLFILLAALFIASYFLA
jgi:hypothetical protein